MGNADEKKYSPKIKQSKKTNSNFDSLKRLEKLISYSFKNKEYLFNAITHSTYTYEKKLKYYENNERLEFLGDCVLDLIVADMLYNNPLIYKEGEMTKIKALVVCENTLTSIANDISLGEFLLLGKGEEATFGRNKPSNLSNAMEALIAAVYLDSGFKSTYNMLFGLINPYIEKALRGKIIYDYKTKLLEFVQSQQKQHLLEFKIVKEEGPEHERKFFSQVSFDSVIIGSGCGSTKKEAEQEASKDAYKKIII